MFYVGKGKGIKMFIQKKRFMKNKENCTVAKFAQER